MAENSHLYLTSHAKVRYGFTKFEIGADDEVELSVRPDLIQQLVPPHCEPELASRSIVLDNFVPIPLEQLKITLD